MSLGLPTKRLASGSWNTRGVPDQITVKLAALHYYQLAIPAPKPPAGSFEAPAAARGKKPSWTRFEAKLRQIQLE